MWIAAELTSSPTSRERPSRTPIELDVGYREGSARGSVHVVDLSPSGVKIESHLLLEPDTHIWLKLPGLEALQARIAWVRKQHAGCEFVRPLHPAVFDRVVAACGRRHPA
jgi:hypothetical protein